MENTHRLVHLDPGSDEALRGLLLYAEVTQAVELAEEYGQNPSWHLHGLSDGDRLTAVVGVEVRSDGSGAVRHIAVAKAVRLRGLGGRLIDLVQSQHSLSELEAETDRDAVEFYRALGFRVQSLGEKSPGVERFRCTR